MIRNVGLIRMPNAYEGVTNRFFDLAELRLILTHCVLPQNQISTILPVVGVLVKPQNSTQSKRTWRAINLRPYLPLSLLLSWDVLSLSDPPNSQPSVTQPECATITMQSRIWRVGPTRSRTRRSSMVTMDQAVPRSTAISRFPPSLCVEGEVPEPPELEGEGSASNGAVLVAVHQVISAQASGAGRFSCGWGIRAGLYMS
jgi:hypothetical protein